MLNDKLIEIGKFIEQQIVAELLAQDHKATGTLINSITSELKDEVNAKVIQIFLADYGKFVEFGVAKERVPFTTPSGRGGTSKYITALINWAQIKFGMDAKKAKGFAFALAHKHRYITGIPVAGESHKFFLKKAIDKSKDEITARINEAVDSDIKITFDNILEKARQKFEAARI